LDRDGGLWHPAGSRGTAEWGSHGVEQTGFVEVCSPMWTTD
jgi:hypothetical protein